jgi:hypothetical protein
LCCGIAGYTAFFAAISLSSIMGSFFTYVRISPLRDHFIQVLFAVVRAWRHYSLYQRDVLPGSRLCSSRGLRR